MVQSQHGTRISSRRASRANNPLALVVALHGGGIDLGNQRSGRPPVEPVRPGVFAAQGLNSDSPRLPFLLRQLVPFAEPYLRLHPRQVLPGRGGNKQAVRGPDSTCGIAVLEKLLLRPMYGIYVNRDSYELVPDELNILVRPVFHSEPELLHAASARAAGISRRP